MKQYNTNWAWYIQSNKNQCGKIEKNSLQYKILSVFKNMNFTLTLVKRPLARGHSTNSVLLFIM